MRVAHYWLQFSRVLFRSAIGLAQPDQAWGQASVSVEADVTRHAGQFVVPVNKSQVLRLDVPFADLLVGNAAIADALALTDRSIYVPGQAPGSTSLPVYGRNPGFIIAQHRASWKGSGCEDVESS